MPFYTQAPKGVLSSKSQTIEPPVLYTDHYHGFCHVCSDECATRIEPLITCYRSHTHCTSVVFHSFTCGICLCDDAYIVITGIRGG